MIPEFPDEFEFNKLYVRAKDGVQLRHQGLDGRELYQVAVTDGWVYVRDEEFRVGIPICQILTLEWPTETAG